MNRITNVQPSSVSLPIGKPLLAVRACGVCGFDNVKPALKINDVEIGHCCLPFIGNLSKCNGTTLIEELESQTKYINSKNKMSKLKIYGASDDLIEIEGAINDEVDCYEICQKGIKFECSDGTKGNIQYHDEWNISLENEGSLFQSLIPTLGEDVEHSENDALGCTSYSDVLVLKEGIEWVKVGRKTFKV